MISLTTNEKSPSRSKRRQRGASLIIFTFLSTLIVIPLIGLAIDGAIIFWVRAKLSSAVDAAALAAGRSINVYETQAQNSGTIVTIGQEWFSANFPSGWLGTTVSGPNITIQPTTTMTQQVSVNASATVPLYFMRVLNINSFTVTAAAQSSRRNVFAVLVLDRSGSMTSNAGGNACPTMQSDAITFVDNEFTEDFDTVGLITYSTTANSSPIDYAPSQTFKTGIATAVNSLACTGATSMTQALHVAYQTILSNGLASGLNIIVLFTDGQPNAINYGSWVTNTAANNGGHGNTVYDPINNQPPLNPPSTVGPLTSGCTANSLSGVFTILLATGTTPSTYGYTGGLYSSANVSLNTAPGLISASGCKFTSNITNNELYAREDLAYMPATDAYGNKTNAGYGTNAAYYGNGVSAPATFPNTAAYPFPNQIRLDEQLNAVVAAAVNSADYQAQVIRNDPTYKIVIYTIGLGGAPDFAIDATLLERMANDPRSPIYNSSKPAGSYNYAPTPAALSQAFADVGSQILRLSQ